MANTITRTILQNGPRNATVLATIVGDGSGEETAALVLDASDLAATLDNYAVTYVHGGCQNCDARLLFDATTDVPFLALPETTTIADWSKFGGVRNFAGDGKTGDIVLATQGLGATSFISVIIGIVKGT